MFDFGLITEGITDHAVISNILLGYFQSGREPDVHFEHPPPLAERHDGGWTLVMDHLRQKKFRQNFQFNKYLIIQIDTDISEEIGFDVSKQGEDGPLSTEQLVLAVIERLKREIGEEDWDNYGDRFIFAIGVHQTECWILPLWFNNNQSVQIANCTRRLGSCPNLCSELTQRNFRWFNDSRKDHRSYDFASRGYRKRSILDKQGRKSPSLSLFLNELDRRNISLPED
ncbi:hypothetical protein [Luteolibacter luteus]|uniref:Uncharacterized protein n=1 Tax=Luteolibacter luteus TaxID=2728835 RepID=A0A858RN76_9BACT|nr:hypothetical protein [Luteolibacter luteus]QJE97954.1 hypothetical protein HHL09_19905 [Luteolibacter luteus]